MSPISTYWSDWSMFCLPSHQATGRSWETPPERPVFREDMIITVWGKTQQKVAFGLIPGLCHTHELSCSICGMQQEKNPCEAAHLVVLPPHRCVSYIPISHPNMAAVLRKAHKLQLKPFTPQTLSVTLKLSHRRSCRIHQKLLLHRG